jgi:transglutaminase-like putative cysteine protease
MLVVRVGCDLTFACSGPTPALFIIKPQCDSERPIIEEQFEFVPDRAVDELKDLYGNLLHRTMLESGPNRIRYDALVDVPSATDKEQPIGEATPVSSLSPEVLQYVLPSRYCDSDKLADFAWRTFGPFQHAYERAQEICDWVHNNIEYRFGSGRPDISASEIIERGFGVCRDFAHCAISLCRTFNLPARYVTGHLPDIGYVDPGTPMDFHAYSEVYIGGRWHTFDARYNVPRIGRIKIAHGRDSVDCAFSTAFGAATLSHFQVWAYQVQAGQVSVGDPVDLSKRLDGTNILRGLPEIHVAM